MCCLVVEIALLIAGLYSLITGRFNLAGTDLEGKNARIAGLLLLAPLPAALCAGMTLGVLVAVGVLSESVRSSAWVIEPLFVLIGLGAAVIFAQNAK